MIHERWSFEKLLMRISDKFSRGLRVVILGWSLWSPITFRSGISLPKLEVYKYLCAQKRHGKKEATRVRNCGRLSKSIFIATATCEFHDAELWKFDLQAAVMHLMWTPNKRTKHLPRNLSQHRQGVSSKDQTAFLDIPLLTEVWFETSLSSRNLGTAWEDMAQPWTVSH